MVKPRTDSSYQGRYCLIWSCTPSSSRTVGCSFAHCDSSPQSWHCWKKNSPPATSATAAAAEIAVRSLPEE